MLITKKIENDEFYLFMDGKLIYKRWLKTGYSKVFDNLAYDKYTETSIRDLQHEPGNGSLVVKALLTLRTTEEGGRKGSIVSGYRPNHVFEYMGEGQMLTAWAGDLVFEGVIEPGETKEVTVRFLMAQPIEQYLAKGHKWWIHEGPNRIGEAVIL